MGNSCQEFEPLREEAHSEPQLSEWIQWMVALCCDFHVPEAAIGHNSLVSDIIFSGVCRVTCSTER